MPFNELMINCIKNGTSHKEHGVSVYAKPRQGGGETILFFAIDSNSNNCSNFPGVINTDVICDLLVYYSTKDSDKKLCLVELKGSDIKHAVKQIIGTKDRTENLLKKRGNYQNINWKALIVHSGSAPRQWKSKKLRTELDSAFGKGNYYMVHKMKYDLGDFIRN